MAQGSVANGPAAGGTAGAGAGAATAAEGPLPRPAPGLGAFRAGEDTRIRDLLAFGLAAEAGRPVAPDAIEGLRRKAEAELHDHAFRLLHNSVEQIRRDAVAEEKARHRPPLGFWAAVAANLLALGIVAGLAWLMLRHPELLPLGP